VLRGLLEVVDRQAKLDPEFDAERRRRIVDTVESQGLFVPAGILFGVSVLPWRPMKIPPGYGVFEVSAQPEFKDSEHRTEAIFDLLQSPGPLYRVDFDTLQTTSLRVDAANAPGDFELAEEWKSTSQHGVHGPAILRKTLRSRLVRITAESPNETAVLRNVRLFAFKEPAAAVCAMTKTAPELDASFKEAAWPVQPQVDGFVVPEANAFAEAQTNVRVCYTRDTLYVAVYAREPRMDTLVATLTNDDAALWEEESFAVEFSAPGGPTFRFVVNPLGARFDSRDGDAAWNGEWQAVAKAYPTGWAAEIAIPFPTLGVRTPAGDSWTFDCTRTRRNVKNEQSVWAYTGHGGAGDRGTLSFATP
jgi:hypothetical protein